MIDAYSLNIFQSCPRRYLLEQSWRVLRWRPKSLFDSCLRQAIFAISNGADPTEQVQAARTRFLSQAANPGLDVSEGADSWIVANDYAGMLSTTLTAVSRLTLLSLERLKPILVGSSLGLDEISWSPLAWADESGVLHRWITVDTYDDGVLARECHGWYVFGDIIMADAPLTLHVISIGQQRNGRRASPWVRAYKHPVIARRFKFQRKNSKGHGTSLSEQWIPFYYTNQPQPDPVAWVDLMDADGITPTLIHHIPIAQPSESVRQDTIRQLTMLANQMAKIQGNPMDIPMSRGACDGIVPCPWQEACYRENPSEGIGDLGLYQIRTLRDTSVAPRPRQSDLQSVAG